MQHKKRHGVGASEIRVEGLGFRLFLAPYSKGILLFRDLYVFS